MSKEYDLGRVVGRDATINGENAIQLIGGNNISIEQTDGTITIGLDGELNNPHFNDKNNPHNVTTEQIGAVPVERKINDKSLTDDITLTSEDVDAVPINRKINNKSLNEDITLTSDDVGAVPTSRTVNDKPLTENISLSASDVGAAPTSHGTHVTYGTTSPKMDGIAGTGSSSSVSRADHVHPSDTSKQDKLTGNIHQVVGFDKDGNAVAKLMDYSLFGFQIDPDEPDPSKKIKYIAQNASYDPAYMDFEKDEFNYGDWGDAWFIKNIKVVILRDNGTVSEELNKNEYSQYANSDVSAGIGSLGNSNLMVGIPTVWIRYASVNNKPTFYFSDVQIDDTYHAYAHTNANGDIIPYTYLSAYNGWKDDDGKLRSYSNKLPTVSETGTAQIAAARANNPTGKNMWDIDVLADRQLINLLLLLIGKSTNTQEVFGNGNMNGKTNPAEGANSNGILKSGTMNNKGLFWGSNADNLGVKVFGIENWWGNVWRRTQGLIMKDGKWLIKMTKRTQDGSTVNDYNTTGNGYIDYGTFRSSGYISKMKYSKFGLFPMAALASNTTYFADYIGFDSSICSFALFGGNSNDGSSCGAFACLLNTLLASASGDLGTGLSCKPE